MPPELLGPTGLAIAAVIAVVVLWRDHLRADEDDRRQRDILLEQLPVLVETTKRLADHLDATPKKAD